MKLYKAINYDGKSEKVFNSGLITRYANVNSWLELVKAMYTYVSHGDRKKEKDCWISVTPSFRVAMEYLYNPKYNFNCVVEIDLPNTMYTGAIFDETLCKYGYVDKDLKNKVLYSRGNQDGLLYCMIFLRKLRGCI